MSFNSILKVLKMHETRCLKCDSIIASVVQKPDLSMFRCSDSIHRLNESPSFVDNFDYIEEIQENGLDIISSSAVHITLHSAN